MTCNVKSWILISHILICCTHLCGVAQADTATPKTPVILYSIDTLRADHLGVYGHERPTSRHIDAFAEDSVRFTKAYTHAAWTLTAHMSMLTGLVPEHHGVTRQYNLSESIPTITEILDAQGYRTGGFVGHEWWLKASRGYGRGFDHYDVPEHYRDVRDTHALFFDWLGGAQEQPLFVFLHNYDVHSKPYHAGLGDEAAPPYDPDDDTAKIFTRDLPMPRFFRKDLPSKRATAFLGAYNAGLLQITPEEQEYIELSYDEGIVKVDREFGKLVAHLKATPYPGHDSLYDAALIILTSDHGESLGDHKRHIHGNVYEENVVVPLIIKFPEQDQAGSVQDTVVSHSDLVPTILDVLQLPALTRTDGISLVDMNTPKWSTTRLIQHKRNNWHAVQEYPWKLVHNQTEAVTQLFHLEKDPCEFWNFWEKEAGKTEQLLEKLKAHFYPAKQGWYLHFNASTQTVEGTIEVRTDAKILDAHLQQGSMNQLTRDDANTTLTCTMKLGPRQSSDTLYLQTEPPGAPIHVTFTLEDQVELRFIKENISATGYQGTLNRDEVNDSPLWDEMLGKDIPPWIDVAYVAHTPKGDKTDAMTQEEREELEALGYLGDDAPLP